MLFIKYSNRYLRNTPPLLCNYFVETKNWCKEVADTLPYIIDLNNVTLEIKFN